MIQQKFKKKKELLYAYAGGKCNLTCPIYSKQANLRGGYSWNKMWPLKSLVILKFKSRSSLHAAQYK